jgi:hypothetical protein
MEIAQMLASKDLRPSRFLWTRKNENPPPHAWKKAFRQQGGTGSQEIVVSPKNYSSAE